MNDKKRDGSGKSDRQDRQRRRRPGNRHQTTPAEQKRPVRNLIPVGELAKRREQNEATPLQEPAVNTGAPPKDRTTRKPSTTADKQPKPEKQIRTPKRKRKTQKPQSGEKSQNRKSRPHGGRRVEKRTPVPRLVTRPSREKRPGSQWKPEDQTTGAFKKLIEPLQRALADTGYETPTPIQEQSIPHLLEGRDILGCAQTGTGKTAAFTLPILQYLHQNGKRPVKGKPRVLVLAPTRELAAQIDDSVRTYGKYLRVFHTVIFGGVSQVPQVKKLQRGLDILVATPGRLLDLMQQGHLNLDAVEVFVLDEADRMLDMGFLPDIRKVIAKLPEKRHSLFFSATLPDEVLKLAHTLVRNPVEITIAPDQPTVEKIDQKVMFVGKRQKTNLLIQLLEAESLDKVIVFTRMKFMANRVADKLNRSGIKAMPIHGNKSQTARTNALDAFKRGDVRVLVATDIAARGIDVDNITHVINYDLPNEAETYVHRIGRTARAGAEGDAVSFCSGEERAYLRDIEKLIRQKIPVDRDHPFHGKEEPAESSDASRGRNRRGRPGPRRR